MAIHTLSKSTFIRGQQCVKSLYLNKFHSALRDRISPEQLAKFKRGTDVGVLARELFPGGIDLSPRSPSQYAAKVKETAEAMLNPLIDVIYEACFLYDGVLILLDILVRQQDKWLACEVKSSLKISDTYKTDAALQYFVLHGSGVQLSDFQLIYMNKAYVLNDQLDLQKLFVSESVHDEVKKREPEIRMLIEEYKRTLQLGQITDIEIGARCDQPYPCDFKGYCWKKYTHNPIMKLHAAPNEQRIKWINQGYRNMFDIPLEELKSHLPNHHILAVLQSTFTFDELLLKQNKMNFEDIPVFFLKAIFHQPAVPEIKGTKPYQIQMLALHLTDGNDCSKSLFVDTLSIDNQSDVLQQLLAYLPENGQLWVWDVYEFLQWKNQYDPEKSYPLQVFGLTDYLRSVDYFHPLTGTELQINDVAKNCISGFYGLKNESYLVSDLLQSPQGNENILRSIKYYCKILQEIFKKLIFEPKLIS